MTHLEIAEFAREASRYAFDAHGVDGCSPCIAGEFLVNFLFEDDSVESEFRAKRLRMILASVNGSAYFDSIYERRYAQLIKEEMA